MLLKLCVVTVGLASIQAKAESIGRISDLLELTPTCRYEGMIFDTFEGVIQVPVGNHGYTSTKILDQCRLVTSTIYGPNQEEVVFDLVSGKIDYSRTVPPNYKVERKSFLPIAAGGQMFPYRQRIQGMQKDLKWISDNLKLLGEATRRMREPQVGATLNFLDKVLAFTLTSGPDSVIINNAPDIMRQGASYGLEVETYGRGQRDLLVEYFDEKWTYLGGKRINVNSGLQKMRVNSIVPNTAPIGKQGYVSVKILHTNRPWNEKLGEDTHKISFRPNEYLPSMTGRWTDNYDGPQITLSVGYFCAKSCVIQAQVYDANGNKVAAFSADGMPTRGENNAQYAFFYLPAPKNVFVPGSIYSFSSQLVILQSDSRQSVDNLSARLTIGSSIPVTTQHWQK